MYVRAPCHHASNVSKEDNDGEEQATHRGPSRKWCVHLLRVVGTTHGCVSVHGLFGWFATKEMAIDIDVDHEKRKRLLRVWHLQIG